jgi:tRNA-splicing ligase RtcB
LLALPLTDAELGRRREPLAHEISRAVPAGAGKRKGGRGNDAGLESVLRDGPRALASDEDIERTESGGCLPGADPAAVSERARERGSGQLGTMGSGNHFVELQRVEHVQDEPTAAVCGLRQDQVTVLIHSGSRGLGHRVCTDYVKRMDAAMRRERIELPDRQLACASASSPEGRAYLAAMAAAANFAWANRQAIADAVREAVARVLSAAAAEGTRQVYDVAHNVAKAESHDGRRLLVHRKGATRAFPAGSADIPEPLPRRRSARLHPGQHGHLELRPRR